MRWLLRSLLLAAAAQPSAAATCDVAANSAVGDGRTVNTASLQRAIDACQGGGRVVIPAGVFVTGTLRLRSHLELHLEPGAVLKGSVRLEIDGLRAQAAPSSPYREPVRLRDGRNAQVGAVRPVR
ncbi:MAG TPA: hypothetical protein VEQ10_14705 [Vicinamibacteria bacterium]|nr:hypothetical protein [Vicinamibacteria bacterium]